jgi:hypothetical protein
MSSVVQVITATSPAAAGTAAATDTATGLHAFEAVQVIGELQGATGGELDVYLQSGVGTRWVDLAHFPQLWDGQAAATWRFTLTRQDSLFLPFAIDVGFDDSPALWSDFCIQGEFGDEIRVLFVAGAGTSAGAVQTVTFAGVYPRG